MGNELVGPRGFAWLVGNVVSWVAGNERGLTLADYFAASSLALWAHWVVRPWPGAPLMCRLTRLSVCLSVCRGQSRDSPHLGGVAGLLPDNITTLALWCGLDTIQLGWLPS